MSRSNQILDSNWTMSANRGPRFRYHKHSKQYWAKSQYGDYPDLPKPIYGWIINHATKNFWRVAAWYELDDLIQDGIMCAYKCREKYGTEIDPPHFMALVKTAFYRHIGQLLRKSRGEQQVTKRVADFPVDVSETRCFDRAEAQTFQDGDLMALIAGMPAALRRAVEVYLSKPEKMRGRPRLDGDSETEADVLRRLAGWSPRFDFATELRAYLWESEHLA